MLKHIGCKSVGLACQAAHNAVWRSRQVATPFDLEVPRRALIAALCDLVGGRFEVLVEAWHEQLTLLLQPLLR
jgi:hypothetical protein